MFQIKTKKFALLRQKTFGGKHKIQDGWENDPYVVTEKPYPDMPVHKVRLSECDNKHSVLHCIFCFHYSVYSKISQNLLRKVFNKTERCFVQRDFDRH